MKNGFKLKNWGIDREVGGGASPEIKKKTVEPSKYKK